jgi:hypothetical protein
MHQRRAVAFNSGMSTMRRFDDCDGNNNSNNNNNNNNSNNNNNTSLIKHELNTLKQNVHDMCTRLSTNYDCSKFITDTNVSNSILSTRSPPPTALITTTTTSPFQRQILMDTVSLEREGGRCP